MEINKNYPVVAWWSGGVVSATVCKLCCDWFGVDNVRILFINALNNEHPSTYTFLDECQNWYKKPIEILKNSHYETIQDVWYEHLSLNISKGAKCSEVLKIKVRQDWIKRNNFSYQAFGFDINELNRAEDMKVNNSHLRPIFPAIASLFDKKDCINFIERANDMFLKISIPEPYKLGYSNNNCFKTGCVKGGIGYWQKILRDDPAKFDAMAKVEHDLTDLKGKPVTICKDQSDNAKAANNGKSQLVFLKPHPNYPNMKDLSMMEGREPEPLMECSAFCSKY